MARLCDVLKHSTDRRPENLANLIKPRGAHAIRAFFVFLDLLVAYPQLPAEALLAHA
jgi:hypothetical protein